MISDINSNKKKWFDTFSIENVVKIGIARKAIRLFELMWRKYRKGEELPFIFSEHAIPFLKDKFKYGNDILLADDSIYFGTTYRRVFAVLQSIVDGSSSIYTLPVVMSEEAKIRLDDITKFPEGIKSEELIIEKSDITNYVNNLTESFKELGKPYDIEFPIFYFQLPEQIELKKYAQVVSHLINSNPNNETPFVADYYEVGKGCSILLNDKVRRNEYVISTDFQKLRFFENEGYCCVVSYAPKFIPDSLLVKDSLLFKNTVLLDIWNEICESIYEIKDNLEYIIHCKRSLAICANYLFSFISFLKIKKIFRDNNEDIKFLCPDYEMKLFDITMLVGDVLAPKMQNVFMELLDKGENIDMPSIGISPIEKYEILPEELAEDFSYHLSEDLNHCKSISELISIYFSNQFHWIDARTKSIFSGTNERFNFGIGFESLIYKALLWNSTIGQESIKKLVHKAIDSRIDEGSVVPRYVMDENSNEHIWLRLFRCGENDDKYTTRLHKLALKILMRIKDRYYGIDNLPKVIVETIFNLIFGNLIKDEYENGRFSNLGGIDFVLRYNKEQQYYSVSAKDENGISFSVYDACVNYKLIKNERGFCEILDSDYAKYLQKDDCLDDRYRRYFNQCIDFIVDLGKVSGGILLTKMVNLLKYTNDAPQLDSDIKRELNYFKSYLTGNYSDCNLDKLRELYYTYPFASVLLDANENNIVADMAQTMVNDNPKHCNGVSADIINMLNRNTEQIRNSKKDYLQLEFYLYILILENRLISQDTGDISYIYDYIRKNMHLSEKLQSIIYRLSHKDKLSHDEIRNALCKIIEKYEHDAE